MKYLIRLLIALGLAVAVVVLLPVLAPALLVVAFIWYWCFRRTAYHPLHALRVRLGLGRGIRSLARRVGMTTSELRQFQPRYREHQIPKRSGGTRTLWIPDEATMKLQRTLLATVFSGLRPHPAATGFVPGKSIVDNARPHVGQRVLLKIDIVDFFPATQSQRVTSYLQRVGWSRGAAKLLTRLVCHQNGLPQGAPTSPLLSNVVNYKLDVNFDRIASRFKGNYTRYADDITFSFPKDHPRKLRGITLYTRKVLKKLGYRIQWKKVRYLRAHQRQTVTGLNVNSIVSLPRELRRKLRAARHRMRHGQEATWTAEQLQGWLALESMILSQRNGPGQD